MNTIILSAGILWLIGELLFQNLDAKARPFVIGIFITVSCTVYTFIYNEANASAWEIVGLSVLSGIFLAIVSWIIHAANLSGTGGNGGDEGSWASGWNGDCDGGGDGGGD